MKAYLLGWQASVWELHGGSCVLFWLTERQLKTLAHNELGDIPVLMSSMEKDTLKGIEN